MFKEFSSRNGWNAFVENDWTRWAKKHGLKLAEQKISFIKKRRKDGVVLAGGKIRTKNLHDEMKNWYKFKSEPFEKWTISEYKKIFKNKRPDWARTFAERDISSMQVKESRYKVKLKISAKDRSTIGDFCTMEKEFILPEKKIIAERLLDKYGQCKRVSLIYIDSIWPSVRQEDWISKGRWSVKWNRSFLADEWVDKRPLTLLRNEKPINCYMDANVAQS